MSFCTAIYDPILRLCDKHISVYLTRRQQRMLAGLLMRLAAQHSSRTLSLSYFLFVNVLLLKANKNLKLKEKIIIQILVVQMFVEVDDAVCFNSCLVFIL